MLNSILICRGGDEDIRLEAKDRPSRGQGQGPRTQMQVFSTKKKGLEKFFSDDLKKKVFKIFF